MKFLFVVSVLVFARTGGHKSTSDGSSDIDYSMLRLKRDGREEQIVWDEVKHCIEFSNILREIINRTTVICNQTKSETTAEWDQGIHKRDERSVNASNTTNIPELEELYDMDNDTSNCTNDYCASDEEYIDMIEAYMFPTSYEWILIGLHSTAFLIGLIGNALVCVAVYRNHTMRTVTNYFIVNLAVADFMVILFCLPPTVLWDVTETWFMGEAMCKIVLYLQTVSVTVSVLTLTFISVDRWYAICFPLKFKSTTGRAKTAIVIIWLVALSFDIPELIVLTTKRRLTKINTDYFTQCEASWSEGSDTTWSVVKMVLLYAFPLAFMSVAYFQIVKVLWQSDNIAGHLESGAGVVGINGTRRNNTFTMNANSSTQAQLRSRRKAAKMLVAVVVMFAVCYFPVHLFSVMRLTMSLAQNDTNTALALLSHWMCYANSAVNPVIYNFMSGKFRREFRRAFEQCCHSTNRQLDYRLNTLSTKNGQQVRLGGSDGPVFRRAHEIRQAQMGLNVFHEAKKTSHT